MYTNTPQALRLMFFVKNIKLLSLHRLSGWYFFLVFIVMVFWKNHAFFHHTANFIKKNRSIEKIVLNKYNLVNIKKNYNGTNGKRDPI